MKVLASAGRTKAAFCRTVHLTAETDDEAAALAVLVEQLLKPSGVDLLIKAAKNRRRAADVRESMRAAVPEMDGGR